MLKLSYCGTRNVSIYAYFSSKFLYHRKYACVKDLTHIMSESMGCPTFSESYDQQLSGLDLLSHKFQSGSPSPDFSDPKLT